MLQQSSPAVGRRRLLLNKKRYILIANPGGRTRIKLTWSSSFEGAPEVTVQDPRLPATVRFTALLGPFHGICEGIVVALNAGLLMVPVTKKRPWRAFCESHRGLLRVVLRHCNGRRTILLELKSMRETKTGKCLVFYQRSHLRRFATDWEGMRHSIGQLIASGLLT